MPSRVCVRVRRRAGVPVRSPHRRLAISLSFGLGWRHALSSPCSKRRGPLSQPLSFRFVPAATPSFAHAPLFGPRRRPAPRASLPVTCAVRSRCCVTHGSFACRWRRCVPGRRRRASLTASFAACACASPPFRCGERCAERDDRVEMAVAAALTTQLLGARGGLRRAMGCVDWVVRASGDAGWGQRAGRGRQREGRGRGGGGRSGRGAGSVGEVTRRCSGQGTWRAAGGASALKTRGTARGGRRCVAFSSLFLESTHRMRAMFFLAVLLAAAGTLVRDGGATAGDTVREFRALCRLATALDAFKHLEASALWGGKDPVTQIEGALHKLAGGGERPCAHRARTFIGGRAQQEGREGGGVAGEACDRGGRWPTGTGTAQADTLLCQAKEAKAEAEEQIRKAKRLAHEALWGKESGTVDEGTLQTKTWADSPTRSTLAGVAKADAHCVASNVLWLCMDGTNTDTANPCFKNAAVAALSSLSSATHSACHGTPATALQVWKALAPLCINETAEEERPAEELATTALAAAENVIAKIHDVSADGTKFILGPQGTTASSCNKNGNEICIKFGSDNNKLNEIYWHARVRSIAAAVKHANTLAAEARNLATHARLTAAQCLATEEKASTGNSTETHENSQTKEDQEADGRANEAQHGGRARRHTESNQDEARTSEKTKAQPATSQHSAATAHRQQHAEAALAILATRLARSARHE
ncbi:hypothetical protein ERJ75_001264900 [Trypanosoma vivax]|nr:hypothetical protein ERJ75_001264900 [Trypanosoma vivax]